MSLPRDQFSAAFMTAIAGITLAIFIIASQAPPSGGDHSSPSTESFEQERPNERIATYNLWLAVFAGMTVVTATLQIYFLRETNRISAESSKAAMTAAESAKTSADAVVASERAWLLYHEKPRFDWTDRKDGGVYVTVYPRLKNHGRTPAILQSVRTDLYYSESSEPRQFTEVEGYWRLRQAVSQDEVLEFSDEISPQVASAQFTPEQEKRIADHNDDATILFVGLVEYEDVFGTLHQTSFCFRFVEWYAEFSPVSAMNYRT